MILQKLNTIGRDLDTTLLKLRNVQRERNRAQIVKGTEITPERPGLDVDAFLNAVQNDALAK